VTFATTQAGERVGGVGEVGSLWPRGVQLHGAFAERDCPLLVERGGRLCVAILVGVVVLVRERRPAKCYGRPRGLSYISLILYERHFVLTPPR